MNEAMTGAVKAAQADILDAFNTGLRVNPDHTQTFFRQRPSGSQWGKFIPSTPQEWASLQWEPISREVVEPQSGVVSGCRYFFTRDPKLMDGAVEHIGISRFLDHSLIKMRDGVHGLELVTTQKLPHKKSEHAWLVLGPFGQHLIPWTAFPGQLAEPLIKGRYGFNGTFASVDLAQPYAVKEIK